jgi:alpha-glucosidase
MAFTYVNVNEFTPEQGQWTSFGNIATHSLQGNVLTLTPQQGPPLLLTFLSATMFRVRFNPAGNYATDNSVAVVSRDFGPFTPQVQDTGATLTVDTGVIQVVINKAPYALAVYRAGQLIHADTPDYNLVYIPGQEVVANFKQYPAGARYYGFGEKAGATLAKNEFALTFFNYDNFSYVSGPLPQGETPGVLNPTEPLYCSVPLLIETNPTPASGARYSYGIFFDNVSQSYFNVGAHMTAPMEGRYYFGALYGDLDYYFIYGQEVPQVVNQYTQLTGRAAMPPRYVFGYHQGCYGYYDQYHVLEAANAYRAARIPIDGLHIDVDFQDNFRTFTNSQLKFPQAKQMLDFLHLLGFKCSTNITPNVTSNRLNEYGNRVPYPTYESGVALPAPGAFLYDTRYQSGESQDLFEGTVNYGVNPGSNPYLAQPTVPSADPPGYSLQFQGNYPDFGRPEVQQWWGEQYTHLINDLGMDMIWQDMTCPALAQTADTPVHTFPLDLMMTYFGEYVPSAKMHNAYVQLLLNATTAGLAQLRPTQRNFIIARGGYAGMQRYAALWTGDSASSWNFLRVNLPEVLNLGLSGIAISGCDIGGFANGYGPLDPANPDNGSTSLPVLSDGLGSQVVGGVTNYELLTRWMHLGSFLPWYRNHYDGYTKQFQEPYRYAEPVPTNCRKYVELRYRMLHVYYSAMYEAHTTGMPIARALFLNDPQDPQVYQSPTCDTQFFVGPHVLVAPILDPHETAVPATTPLRDVYLPAGSNWYAFMDNQAPLQAPVPGGTLITNYYAPLSQVPIYIRAGAILPMRELEQYVGELPENPLTINVYPGADSSYQLYQDDGLSTDYEAGKFRLTTISHTGIANGQAIRVQRVVDGYTPPEPFYYIGLPGTEAPGAQAVQVTRAQASGPLTVTLTNAGGSASLAASPSDAYYYNASIGTTFLKIFDTSADTTATVLFP